jgi:hypothetical protein
MLTDTTGLLRPQIPHANTLLRSLVENGFALDMSETGTGKSYASAAIAREHRGPVVLISPKAVIPQWLKVLMKFGVKPLVIVNYEKIGRGNTPWMKWKKLPDPMKPWKEGEVVEMPFFKFPANALVILDEGHRCKGNDTTNAWMLIALKRQGYKVLVASATLATTPMEMRASGYLSGLHALYNFSDFCRVHGAADVGRYGALSWNADNPEAKKAMMLLNQYLFETSKCASRMRVEDFGDLFPESHIVAEAYDLGANSSKVQEAYEEMEREIAKLEKRCENYSEHIFAIMMAARRKSELLKVPLFAEMVEDLFDEGKSVCIFLNFEDSIDALRSRLVKTKKFDKLIGYIVGGQNAETRQKHIDEFNADQRRVMLCNIKAGGIGVSLHDLNGNFPRASIVSPNFSAFELVQALGRVWRQGGLTKSYQNIVFAAGTIEEQACRRVQARIDNLSTLNDADLREGIQIFG